MQVSVFTGASARAWFRDMRGFMGFIVSVLGRANKGSAKHIAAQRVALLSTPLLLGPGKQANVQNQACGPGYRRTAAARGALLQEIGADANSSDLVAMLGGS